jgi:hypothetical protein
MRLVSYALILGYAHIALQEKDLVSRTRYMLPFEGPRG